MNYIPSVYAHIISGAFLFLSIIFLTFYVSKISSRDPLQIVGLLLLFSIAMGVHGISHMGLESLYGYNPLLLVSGK